MYKTVLDVNIKKREHFVINHSKIPKKAARQTD